MHSILSNLSLLFLVIAKALLMTGIGPGIFIAYVAEMLVKADRVPARKLFGKVVSDVERQSQLRAVLALRRGSRYELPDVRQAREIRRVS
jgi:hypothetical protein